MSCESSCRFNCLYNICFYLCVICSFSSYYCPFYLRAYNALCYWFLVSTTILFIYDFLFTI